MTAQLLDRVLNSLSNDAIQYFFPGYVREQPASQPKVVPQEKEDSGIRFRIEPKGNADPGVLQDSEIRFSVRGSREKNIYSDILKEDEAILCPRVPATRKSKAKKEPKETSIIKSSRKALRALVPEPKPMDMEPDTRTKAILDEIEAIQERFGVTIEEIEAVLSYRVKLSHLRITKHKAIILEDFDMREVKMDTLTKAVFLLYLKHSEGIRYKDLCDHRRELEDIYMSISGRSDLEGIRKSISDLTDPIMSNSINEKVSKVKKAFRDTVDDRIARFYYIDGKQGAAKSIALDRSLVIWE